MQGGICTWIVCKALHTHLRVRDRHAVQGGCAKVCKVVFARGCGALHTWVYSCGSVQSPAYKAVRAHGGVSVSKGGLARGCACVCTWLAHGNAKGWGCTCVCECARAGLHVAVGLCTPGCAQVGVCAVCKGLRAKQCVHTGV